METTMNKLINGASFTHRGLVKKNNEDAILLSIPKSSNGYRRGVMMIADGVGGHLAGEVASDLAIQTVNDSIVNNIIQQDIDLKDQTLLNGEKNLGDHLSNLLQKTVLEANRLILEYANQHKDEASNLGTTATCGLVYQDLLVIAHVGDSRAYLLRNGVIQQLTDDHTFVGELVRQGQLSSDAFYDHPRRHVITRALGQKPDVEVDTKIIQIQAGDRLLFCSDGLWEMVREEHLKRLLSAAETPQEAVDQLFASAMEAGGVDNIGVVVGDIND